MLRKIKAAPLVAPGMIVSSFELLSLAKVCRLSAMTP
jgi:hypothetical protein